MTEVLPFRGILYNRERFRGDEVVSPPYDIITEDMRERLYARSPYNFVRIDFGKDSPGDNDNENRYTRAASLFSRWRSDGILVRSQKPCYYLCEVRYSLRNEEHIMRGIFGAVRITELCKGVFPHEETHSKPKADRLNLMRSCHANLSPVFSIYNKPGCNTKDLFEKIAANTPYMEAKDPDGALHRLWVIDDDNDITYLRSQLSNVSIYIADGHHRYETAINYKKEMERKNPSHTGDEPYNFVMMYLVNLPDGGLSILPTHRLLRGISIEGKDPEKTILNPLQEHFDIYRIEDPHKIMEAINKEPHLIGLYIKGLPYAISLRHRGSGLEELPEPIRRLDVAVLHQLIIGEIFPSSELAFEMDPELTLKKVQDGEYEAAFFLRPTSLEEVERVSLECLRMPPKSTYFYPKVLTGLVINSFDEA